MPGFHTIEQLGPVQAMTKDGFLIAMGVPIARTGTQIYGEGELQQIKGGADGLIHVHRTEEEVFADAAIASFEGKPVVVHAHPPGKLVTPQNSKQLKVGHVQNVRRGEGDMAHTLVADMVFTDETAIDLVRSKRLRHVSAGYTARYQQITPGQAVQRFIHGNHVAVVPEGRAGVICSIGDSVMTTPKPTAFQRLLSAFRSQDADTFHDALVEAQGSKPEAEMTIIPTVDESKDAGAITEERIAGLEARLGKMETAHADVAGRVEDIEDDLYEDQDEGNKKDETKTGDAATAAAAAATAEAARLAAAAIATGDALKKPSEAEVSDVMSRAEILSPGLEVATGDAAETDTDLVEYRRTVLGLCLTTGRGRHHVRAMLRTGMTLDTLTNDQVVSVFNGAAELARRDNNAITSAARAAAGQPARKGPPTPDEMNEANRKFWAGQNGR